MTFASFSFDSRIDAGIKSCGYATPTPIQSQTIPFVLQGLDVMGLARTGTGKTAAFALPILQRLLASKSGSSDPEVLILAPTRELALQIQENFCSLGSRTGIRSAAVIGGVGMRPQIKALRSSKVIVACPGRLVHLINDGVVNLKNIHTLVLDEADRMLDMGFMPDIKRIIARLPAKRQNLLFSATMPNDIRTFANRILVDPKVVSIESKTEKGSISHSLIRVARNRKDALLKDILSRGEHRSMLVFTRTKHLAKRLAQRLTKSGFEAVALQGNMSQNQRQKALQGFKNGQFSIMVATDIAARGIDCDTITHVINYDMPDTVETYTHRIGRTGRAGRSGHALSLVTSEDFGQVKAIERGMRIRFRHEEVDERFQEPEGQQGRTRLPQNADGENSRNRNGSRNRNSSRNRNRSESRNNAGNRNSSRSRNSSRQRRPAAA